VDEYLRNGFRSIFLRALNPYGRAVSNRAELQYPMEEFIASYKDGLDHIIELNLRGEPFVEEYAALILTRMLTPFATGFVDLQSPTGAGIGGVIYDYDGSVYVSDEGRMLARTGDRTFRMGSVHENTYEQLFGGEVIRRTVDASCVECLPQCSDCAFQMWCGADPVRNYTTQGDMIGHRPTNEFCRKNKPLIQHLLGLVKPQLQDVLWSWITRRPVGAVRALGCKESACGA
jgi:sulfatase maturation enzyme AslB (radical SAM superfamily)